MHKWLPLGLAARQLSLPVTLTCGQSFRWVALPDGRWGGVVAGKLVLLRQRDDAIEFSPVNCSAAGGEAAAEKLTRALLLDYFHADAPLERMYEDWSRRAPHLSAATRHLTLACAGPTSASSSWRPCSRACACCGKTLTSACSHSCAAATTTSWCRSIAAMSPALTFAAAHHPHAGQAVRNVWRAAGHRRRPRLPRLPLFGQAV
jgi:hypothetical protein